tara:strand:- start:2206 stop:2763 length:558 start_codon:yes stop_codon:yes gene_type:complete
MVQESVFRGVISFLGKIGVYDVILPFLLVFTIVFAVLEKTKVLGTEKVEGKDVTKKNLNSMVAFVISFLVIASTKLVSVINEAMANMVLLLILVVSYLMLVGVFFGSKEVTLEKYEGWTRFFMVIMFIGIVLIFLNALDWLQYVAALFVYWDSQWASSIILLIVVLVFMIYITKESKPQESKPKE